MERVEYTAEGNSLGISIKYPEEIRRKWSECHEDIECECCGSTDISADKSGDLLVLACHGCPNYWTGSVDGVLTWHDTEEALLTLWRTEFEAA